MIILPGAYFLDQRPGKCFFDNTFSEAFKKINTPLMLVPLEKTRQRHAQGPLFVIRGLAQIIFHKNENLFPQSRACLQIGAEDKLAVVIFRMHPPVRR
jgi:hypothetical protein